MTTAVYATKEELKARIQKGTSVMDTVLDALLEAASRAIDGICNRPDGFKADSAASARVYTGDGGPVQWIDECTAITLVEVKASRGDSAYAAWASTDWIAFSGDAQRPNFNRLPYTGIMVDPTGAQSYFTEGRSSREQGWTPHPDDGPDVGAPTVRVTAKWGRAAGVPPMVREATITLAARWFKRGESAWADTTGSPDLGQLMYRQSLDPDIKTMLIEARLVRPAMG